MSVFRITSAALFAQALVFSGTYPALSQASGEAIDICRICSCDGGHVNCRNFAATRDSKEVELKGTVKKEEIPETIRQLDAAKRYLD